MRDEPSEETPEQREVGALADELVPIFYAELKRLAHGARRRFGGDATLQTTALVHEAYLKLRGARGWNDDAHFLRAAALAMRHALVNHAEARLAAKRGGGLPDLELDEALNLATDRDQAIVAVDEALRRLSMRSRRLAAIVECRFFAGYNEAETGRALSLSERTVRRDWALARAWLHRELGAAR